MHDLNTKHGNIIFEKNCFNDSGIGNDNVNEIDETKFIYTFSEKIYRYKDWGIIAVSLIIVAIIANIAIRHFPYGKKDSSKNIHQVKVESYNERFCHLIKGCFYVIIGEIKCFNSTGNNYITAFGKNKIFQSIVNNGSSVKNHSEEKNKNASSIYGYEHGGPFLSEVYGEELSQKLNEPQIKELKTDSNLLILKSIATNIIESVTIGMSFQLRKLIVYNFLSGFIEMISKHIYDKAENKNQEITASIFNLYSNCGIEKSRRLINKWTEEALLEEICYTKLSIENFKIWFFESLAQKDLDLKILFAVSSKFSEYWIIFETEASILFFEKIHFKIIDHLKTQESLVNRLLNFIYLPLKIRNSKSNKQKQYYKNFKSEIELQWEILLKNRINNNLKTLISIGLEDVFSNAIHTLTDIANKYSRDNNEKSLRKQFDEIVNNRQNIEPEDYYRRLSIFMAKTKDSKLHADIIRKNSPADLVCVQAASNILGRSIQIIFPKKTIYFKPTGQDLNETPIIIFNYPASNTSLGHFSSVESSNDTNDYISDNNCLFQAILENNPIEGLGNEQLRERIATYISESRDENITRIFENNWNRYLSSEGYFGGIKPHQREKKAFEIPVTTMKFVRPELVEKNNKSLYKKKLAPIFLKEIAFDLMEMLFKKMLTSELFHVYHRNLQSGTIVETTNFRVDLQKSTEKFDNYQIQIKSEAGDIYTKAKKTSICGILIDKPNAKEIYELESDCIKKAFALAIEKQDLIRVVIDN